MKYVAWTNHEIRRLREQYGKVTPAELTLMLPRHSLNAIQTMARRLHVGYRRPVRDWRAICAAHKPTFLFERIPQAAE